jgi:hypothetical protein
MINFDTWEVLHCIVCGKSDRVSTCYKPKTCDSYECVHTYIHDREYYDTKARKKGVMLNQTFQH